MTIYLIFLILGSLLLTAALLDLKGRMRFVRRGERAVGAVTQLVEIKDDEGTMYFPVFEIHTSRQEVITYRHATASSYPRWKLGETAAFVFEPGKPETIRFLRYWTIFWWPVSLLAVAVDLLVIGGGYFLLRGYFGA